MPEDGAFTWRGWLDSALPGDRPLGRAARIEVGTGAITGPELVALAEEAGVSIRVVELPMHPSVVGRIFAVESAGPPGSAIRDATGISVLPTHTGDLLVHLGRQVREDESYLASEVDR